MNDSYSELKKIRILFCILHFAILISAAFSQSTTQSYPTAITSNEISGQIPARDIGDARLTNYFYTFNGNQGDIFINVQTSNFNGDIDVFTADNLKPLTKITIYADDTNRETGRVVYLRQSTKLILRIEGRTPNDDPATFRMKFAGSFEPAPFTTAENAAPEMPEVKSENQTGVRVNSVGTIIEVKPKPVTPPDKTIAAKRKTLSSKKTKTTETTENNERQQPKQKEVAVKEDEQTSPLRSTEVKENTTEEKNETANAGMKNENDVEQEKSATTKPTVSSPSVTENTAKQDAAKTEETITAIEESKTVEKSIATVDKKVNSEKKTEKSAKLKPPAKSGKSKEEPNPLDNVHLVILFKDGTRIERAMSQVVKVGVDRGVLTVISNDGSIGRYSILDVARMTIE